MDLHPGGEALAIRKAGLQGREIEPAFFQIGIVTFDAVLIEERDGIGRRKSGREKEEKS